MRTKRFRPAGIGLSTTKASIIDAGQMGRIDRGLSASGVAALQHS